MNILFNFSVGWKAGVGQALAVSSQAENYTDRHQLHQPAKSTYLPPLQISKCRCSSCQRQLLSDYAHLSIVSVCQMGLGGTLRVFSHDWVPQCPHETGSTVNVVHRCSSVSPGGSSRARLMVFMSTCPPDIPHCANLNRVDMQHDWTSFTKIEEWKTSLWVTRHDILNQNLGYN